jgi:hypothetical protein
MKTRQAEWLQRCPLYRPTDRGTVGCHLSLSPRGNAHSRSRSNASATRPLISINCDYPELVPAQRQDGHRICCLLGIRVKWLLLREYGEGAWPWPCSPKPSCFCDGAPAPLPRCHPQATSTWAAAGPATLFVPKRLDGVQVGSPHGRIQTRPKTHYDGHC